MSEFKNQFNKVFSQAPSFSNQARQNVKRKIIKQKTNRRWSGLIGIAIAAVVVSVFIFNEQLFDRLNTKKTASLNFATEHGDLKQEVISDILIERDSQILINNTEEVGFLNSMNRENFEYIEELVIETNFDEVNYGQVVLVEEEEGVVDYVHRYELARVIGKPGDRVKIESGQIYLNNKPIEAFYGKAQDAYLKSVEESIERANRINQQEYKEKIIDLLNISMDEVTVRTGELFIVSDNWANKGIRKVINESSVEGIVLGYKHERDETVLMPKRALTEEEFATIKLLSEQVLAAFETKDFNKLRTLVTGEVIIYNHVEQMLDMFGNLIKIEKQFVTDEIVESFFMYKQFNLGSPISLAKEIAVGYKYKDQDKILYMGFYLENGQWKFSGFGY